MKLYRRENYLKKIRGFYHDDGTIKVITGLRRCGKSCLMATIAEELREQGVAEQNIIFIDLDQRNYQDIQTGKQLEKLIDQLTGPIQGRKYLFIDEIQNVDGFEKIVNAFRTEGDYSIFITGSNSYLLSGELVTKLTGRYLEFEMFTLTFEEYEGMKAFYHKPINPVFVEEFDRYLLEGGFPKAIEFDALEDKQTYTKGVIREIFEKDIRRRVTIHNRSVFALVQQYLINNFGTTASLSNILKELKKDGVYITRETLHKYIQVLIDAKIIYECERFDVKSKRMLKGEKKYYLADLSFYFVNNTDHRINYGPILENVIFLHAQTNGYAISVGRIGKLECDFIVRDLNNEYAYIQVAMTIMNSRDTEDREYTPLELIRDNYPKYVVTRNDPIQRRNGIKHVNIDDFMKNYLQDARILIH